MGSQGGHVFHHGAFIGLVLFDGLNQLFQQIVTSFQLHVDIAPRGQYAVLVSHQQVKCNNGPHEKGSGEQNHQRG